jgi:hypothetical protein
MNSNALNVAAGLLLPATIVGLGASSTSATLVVLWYLGLTVLALGCAYAGSGLLRGEGVLIICAYLAFAGLILTSAYSSTVGMLLGTALPVILGAAAATWMMRRRGRPRRPQTRPRRAPTTEERRSRGSS